MFSYTFGYRSRMLVSQLGNYLHLLLSLCHFSFFVVPLCFPYFLFKSFFFALRTKHDEQTDGRKGEEEEEEKTRRWIHITTIQMGHCTKHVTEQARSRQPCYVFRRCLVWTGIAVLSSCFVFLFFPIHPLQAWNGINHRTDGNPLSMSRRASKRRGSIAYGWLDGQAQPWNMRTHEAAWKTRDTENGIWKMENQQQKNVEN